LNSLPINNPYACFLCDVKVLASCDVRLVSFSFFFEAILIIDQNNTFSRLLSRMLILCLLWPRWTKLVLSPCWGP